MDIQTLIWIDNNLHSYHGFSMFVKGITFLGNGGWIWIAVCAVLLISGKTRYGGVTLAAALILDLIVVNLILKNAVGRERPWTEYPGFETFYDSIGLAKPTDSSFPSGHTAVSFCAAAVLCLRFGWKGAPSVVLALLIALSRLYLCVHYPTDVIGGALIGAVTGAVAVLIVNIVRGKIQRSKDGRER